MRLGALILSGGASSRMGGDKAVLPWLGVRAIDRVAALASELGAELVLAVGPDGYGLPSLIEDPPGGGPVAGLMAGAARLRADGCDRALILAVDAPTALAKDIAPLLVEPGRGAAYQGLHLPLVVDLDALPADAGPNWAMGRLVEAAGVRRLACPPGAEARLRGANTPAEREALLRELQDRGSAQEPGAD